MDIHMTQIKRGKAKAHDLRRSEITHDAALDKRLNDGVRLVAIGQCEACLAAAPTGIELTVLGIDFDWSYRW